jgi:hypothetical protein
MTGLFDTLFTILYYIIMVGIMAIYLGMFVVCIDYIVREWNKE